MITVYGVPGWGSTISELMLSRPIFPTRWLTWRALTSPVRRASVCGRLIRCAVPTLRLADGSIMTETAAIALMILDQRPDLAPRRTPQRPQFQRLLVWQVANVYPTFTYADYPERWAPAAAGSWWRIVASTGKSLSLVRTAAGRRAVGAGRVGNVAGLLYRGDVPLGTRRAWFDDHAPKFAAIARAVCQRPELARRYAVTS